MVKFDISHDKFFFHMSVVSPIHSLRLDGKIVNGICNANYSVLFQNHSKSSIEASFTYPFPPSFCPTCFTICYHDKKQTVTLTKSKDSTIAYDDALASNDFAARAFLKDDNRVILNIGYLKPDETCIAVVSFVCQLSLINNILLFALPAAIPKKEQGRRHFPTFSLLLQIEEDTLIKAITTTNDHTNIKINDSKNAGIVENRGISCTECFTLAITSCLPKISRCFYDTYEDHSYLLLTSTSPRVVRNVNTAFTLAIEQSYNATVGQLSLILRAAEFFILSIPLKSRLNIVKYGEVFITAFHEPIEITDENRNQFFEFTRDVQQRSAYSPSAMPKRYISFENANESIKDTLPNDMESAVIVIGTAFSNNIKLDKKSKYFFLDPLGKGDTRDFAHANGASYIPVPDQNSLFSSLLSVIKMTASLPFENAELKINEVIEKIPPLFPSMSFEIFFQIDKKHINQTNNQLLLNFDGELFEVSVNEDSTKSVHYLWAYESINNCRKENYDNDDDGEIDFEFLNSLLFQEDGGVIVFETEDVDLSENVTFIEVDLGSTKESPRFQSKYREINLNNIFAPTINPQNGHNNTITKQKTENRRSMVFRNSFVLNTMNNNPNRLTKNEKSRFYEGDFPQYFRNSIKPIPHVNFSKGPNNSEINKNVTEENKTVNMAKKSPTKKKPFFMLRLMQLQTADGSFKDQNAMNICCGAEIPENYPFDIPLVQFLTAFAIAAFMKKAPADKEKWELVTEKGFIFLESQNPEIQWKNIINEIISVYFAK
ncbi:hypothetical protein TRFO_30784 [Tritrichomonas foetus]|uniref:VIT domain-containing protein n=1 Tax=Tritrichomonas foetus TaxID=1144522 RepID=A0A1J4JY62_9EUKA|nr:hypothetical protein TRFO_30784 [Tritrichomonas foetus]|eukprot:OHT02213.1 hypothetical protein TRFO_30784 [Tritrichomonas foetus]